MRHITETELIEKRNWNKDLISIYLAPIDKSSNSDRTTFDYAKVINIETRLAKNGINFKVKK